MKLAGANIPAVDDEEFDAEINLAGIIIGKYTFPADIMNLEIWRHLALVPLVPRPTTKMVPNTKTNKT